MGKGITLTGAGSGSTTINGSGQDYALSLDDADSGSYSGFTISGADYHNVYLNNGSDGNGFSSLVLSGISGGSDFEMTRHPFSYSGNNYINLPASGFGVSLLIDDDGSNDFVLIDENDKALTSSTITGQDWNLALVSDGSTTYLTFWCDDNVFDNQSALDTYLSTNFPGYSVDFWDDLALTYSGGVYTYNAPTGPSILYTYQSSPIVPAISDSSSAMRIVDSDSTSFTNSTVSGNFAGVFFSGSTTGSLIGSSVTFSSNTFDLYHTASADNTVDGSSGDYAYKDIGSGTLNFGSSNVPEFSTYLLIITLLIGICLIYRRFGYMFARR